MKIETSNSIIRPWQAGDEHSLSYNANNKKIADNLRDHFPHPYTLEDAVGWIEFQKEIPQLINFAIEVEGKAVGGIGLVPGKDISRVSAEIGYWLGEDYWGKGIISEAIPPIVKYGFEELGFHKIYAGVFQYNEGSKRVLEKNGFVKEAVLRKGAIKNGELIDEHYYAIWKTTP